MAKPEVRLLLSISFLAGIFFSVQGIGFLEILGLAMMLAFGWSFYRARQNNTHIDKLIKSHLGRFGLSILLILMFTFGYSYFVVYNNSKEAFRSFKYNENSVYTGTIKGEEKISSSGHSIVPVELRSPKRGKVTLISDKIGLEFGQVIEIEGAINASKNNLDNPIIAFPDSLKIIGHQEGFSPREQLITLKKKLISGFGAYIPEDESALLSGITFGVRNDFSAEFTDAMRKSGTTHIVALSGYNIAILVTVLSSLALMFLNRKTSFYFTGIGIFLFVAMVGFEPSIVRAAIMGFLALLGRYVGRFYSFSHATVYAALIMVLVDPTSISTLGFQLSFMSLMGLAYLEPAIRRAFNRDKYQASPFSIRDNLITTASAQLAVMPLLITTFGYVSFSGFLANALILPTVPLAMFLGFVTAGFQAVFVPMGFAISWLARMILEYETGMIYLFSNFGTKEVSGSAIWIVSIFYYFIIWIFVSYYSNERGKGEIRLTFASIANRLFNSNRDSLD